MPKTRLQFTVQNTQCMASGRTETQLFPAVAMSTAVLGPRFGLRLDSESDSDSLKKVKPAISPLEAPDNTAVFVVHRQMILRGVFRNQPRGLHSFFAELAVPT